MKSLRLIAAGAALAAVSVVPASAQTSRPAGQPAAPASAPSLTGKVAVIDSGSFSDEKEGIARVVNAMKGVDAQFQPQRNELQQMQTRLNSLADEIQKTGAVSDPKALAAKQDQATQLKTDIERRAQDAQTAYQKRMGEVLDPLQQDVFNALQAYAQQRGIAIVIDQNRVPVLYAADSIDITRDFITEYNRTHPATAAAATPGRP
jgi:outer membrane protein